MVAPQRLLVTGATGGLGRVLVPLLCGLGHAVVATGRNVAVGAGLRREGAQFVAADLAHDDLADLLQGVDTVFHLAALSSPWGRRSEFVAANVTATQRLLQAAQAGGCARFIHVSTPSIYTDTREQLAITESSPLPARWANLYTETKFAAEQRVLAAASRAMAAVVLRPRAIVSPFDRVLLPRLIRAARRGRLVLPEHGRALVELTDARDVASALIAASRHASEVNAQVFNISGGQPRPLHVIARQVCDRLGLAVTLRSVDARLALRLAGLLEFVAARLPGRPEPPITRYGAMVASWSQTFDLSAARTRLHWQPAHAPEAAIDWALSGRGHA